MSNLLKKAFIGFIMGVFLFCIYEICFVNNEGIVNKNEMPVPYGVNLGGIFLLEDWFFSNHKHTFLVDTGPDKPEGLIKNVIKDYKGGKKFFGECDLVEKLKNDKNYDDNKIFDQFNKHRDTYFSNGNFDALFYALNMGGINQVRLPITWCLIYDKEYTVKGYLNGEINTTRITSESKLVKDPYFKNKHWVGIPIQKIKNILESAASNNVKVLIDFHTFLGGSSVGSYSGTWPENPRFWNNNKIAIENMKTIMENFCDWIKEEGNKKALSGLYGITPMNEPAHMAGISPEKYPYWTDKETRFNEITEVLNKSIDVFRNSKLQNHGVKLVMNIIETSTSDFGADNFSNWKNWWKSATKPYERQEWVGLDVHHYEAWYDGSGCVKGGKSESSGKNASFKECYNHLNDTDWSEVVYGNIRNQLVDPDELFYVSEFSNSLSHDTRNSFASGLIKGRTEVNGEMVDPLTLRNLIYNKQVNAMNKNNIKGFFWNWDMIYNENYKNEWSFKNLFE
tara:strand:- start:33 stop:1556 length:1524 start_codon:yes stop_codon:yes gene_type:complete